MAHQQANPFAAPPFGGQPGDPNMQQQQPVQAGNPFAGFQTQTPAATAVSPSPTPEQSFVGQTPMQMMPNGTAAAAPPQQQQAPPIQMQAPSQQSQEKPMQMQAMDPFSGAPTVVPPVQQNGNAFPVQAPQQQGFQPQMAPQQQSMQPQMALHQGMQSSPPQQQGMMTGPPQPQGMMSAPDFGNQMAPAPAASFASPPPTAMDPFGGGYGQPPAPAAAPVSGAQPPQFAQQQTTQTPMAPIPQQQQPVDPFSNALVPSVQQTNPYAQSVAPQPAPQPMAQPQANPFGGQQQALVPTTQQPQSQWAAPGAAAATTAVNPFDPFAPPPPPAPAPAPPQSTELVPAQGAPQPGYQVPEFPFDADQVQAAPPQQEQPPPEPAGSVGPPVSEVNAYHGAQSVVSEQETTMTRRSDDRGYSGGGEMVVHQPQPNLQNKYSKELARNAPPGCAPLPKGELVTKSGYILSRISFRTILMKKWKQTYWVQYGRHTMLWFRSENHFNEWLSNPYLSQAQRNFLVKLAINFVHDLYKPNVRGYQVTQSHSKPYGRKIIRQFKLERWMDYGPTIAAAFGSTDQREVDVLRQTIIDCMRNTPLENGIRATGAVRQDHHDEHRNDHGEQRFSYDDYQAHPRGQRE